MITPVPKQRPDTGHVRRGDMAERRFLDGAFFPDGTPNIPSQAYADYLEAQSMTPRADPVDDAEPVQSEQYFTSNLNKYDQQPFSNFGYDVAGDYLSSALSSFKNAATGQGVATMLPEMAFYPGGPTGLEKVYGGVADTTLGMFSTIVAGLGGITGYLAEQVPFQSEEKEDLLSRDLLGSVEFLEQKIAPYVGAIGIFSQLGRASRIATAANRLPVARVEDAVEVPEFGALAAQQQQAQEFDELLENIDFEEIEDAVDPDFIPVEDIRIDPTQPVDIVETTPAPFSMLEFDERMRATQGVAAPEYDDMLLDAILNPTDAERLEEGFMPIDDDITDIVDYEMVPDDNILDDAAEAADEAARAAEKVDIEQLLADTPITSINEAVNTEQLRELYASYNLPIPTTKAEELAANIIIESNNKKIANSQIGNLPPSQRQSYVPPEYARQGADLDYLKAHAPADVYNKQGPTILEAKLTEQQEGRLGALPPINSGNDGPRIAPEFYSSAVNAAKSLSVKSASYKELKRLMLKQKGVKVKELEWSGADEAFEGRNDVTPQELTEYLEDNTNLIEAKTIQGGPDNSGNINVLEERYIDRELPKILEDGKETFIDEWQDLHADMESVQAYAASENYAYLDRFAETSSVGVETGKELAEKFPDGWIFENNQYETTIFDNKEDAANFDWNEKVDEFRDEIRESLEERLSDAQGTNEYLDMLFPDGNRPDWAENMDTELEYAEYFPRGGTNMRETTYQFRDPTGKLDDDYFEETHFGSSDRADNLVAHARTAEFPVEGGGRAYHVGEAQSDMQQGIRDLGATPRTREQEVAAIKVTDLKDDIRMATTTTELRLNKAIFGDEVGLGVTYRREKYPEALETYKTIVANFKSKYLGTQFSSSDINLEHTFFKESAGNTEELQNNLYNFAYYIIDNKNTVPTEYVTWAKNQIMTNQQINKLKDRLDKNLEIYGDVDLSNEQVGAPFVESTDAWVDMVLRRQLADAVESGADYITLPNPEMVVRYTQGDLEGHRQFYGNIAPKNLLNIAKSADQTAELFPLRIQTDGGMEDVLALPLTPQLIKSLQKKGLPNYMLPFGIGGAAGFGSLGSITNDERTGGAI